MDIFDVSTIDQVIKSLDKLSYERRKQCGELLKQHKSESEQEKEEAPDSNSDFSQKKRLDLAIAIMMVNMEFEADSERLFIGYQMKLKEQALLLISFVEKAQAEKEKREEEFSNPNLQESEWIKLKIELDSLIKTLEVQLQKLLENKKILEDRLEFKVNNFYRDYQHDIHECLESWDRSKNGYIEIIIGSELLKFDNHIIENICEKHIMISMNSILEGNIISKSDHDERIRVDLKKYFLSTKGVSPTHEHDIDNLISEFQSQPLYIKQSESIQNNSIYKDVHELKIINKEVDALIFAVDHCKEIYNSINDKHAPSKHVIENLHNNISETTELAKVTANFLQKDLQSRERVVLSSLLDKTSASTSKFKLPLKSLLNVQSPRP
jgi:hypothetical protein